MGRRGRHKNKGDAAEGDADGSAQRPSGMLSDEFNRPAEPHVAAHPTEPGCAVVAYGKRVIALDARCVY
jgi:hypothetical protein